MNKVTRRPRKTIAVAKRELVSSSEFALRKNPNLYATIVVYEPNRKVSKEDRFASKWEQICTEMKKYEVAV